MKKQFLVLPLSSVSGFGVTITLRGDSIDGGTHVVISEINPDGDNNEDSLICRSGIPISEHGAWYLHRTKMSIENSDEIVVTDPRGWNRTTDMDSEGHQLVGLRRGSATAEEGVFTCHIPGDKNTPISVGIFYSCEIYVS